MTDVILPRKLWYVDLRERKIVDQDFLLDQTQSIVILGEAGMGKSTLLSQLKDLEGYSFCTARKLLISADPKPLLQNASTLVIDGLDEVSAPREGDAVDLVLRRLAELELPRFVLSCRVADWRGATARQGIAEIYDQPPLEIHLEPLSQDDAKMYLSHALSDEEAEATIGHLENLGLSGLWRNPQTLKLVREVANQGRLPKSKGELFAEATRLLRIEHRTEKANSALATLPEKDVLAAAGAGFAALIVTDKEALSRETRPAEFDAPIAEITSIASAARLSDVLDSRLFEARSSDRFTYTHRAIGEFLGARWLAEQADTPRKQRRLLELLNNPSLVPASLRGIHAWLAWHSPALAEKVIASDPMGVIEYGDAENLTKSQSRTLLKALLELSKQNPWFRDWSDYRVGGLVQPGMLSEVRDIISDSRVEVGLRLLVLQALRHSELVPLLRTELLTLLLDTEAVFALRSEAGDRLVGLTKTPDWLEITSKLIEEKSENGARLAIELTNEIGFEHLDNGLILGMVEENLGRAASSVGVFLKFSQTLPDERIDIVLDFLAKRADPTLRSKDRDGRRLYFEIKDLAFALLKRRLKDPPDHVERLWSWLRPFDSNSGVDRESSESISNALETNDNLRQAIQNHVLLIEKNDLNIWQRLSRLLQPAAGLRPSEDDLIQMLNRLPTGDLRWRELVELSGSGPEQGLKVRAAAERFASGDEDAMGWLSDRANPRTPDWQIEQERRAQERAAQIAAEWNRHREQFSARIDSLRNGEYGSIINPAKAYLKLFSDMDDEPKDGPARIEQWLGSELRDAALAGFETFLVRQPPFPSAEELASSYADSKRWDAAYIIVAALAERVRTNRGFIDLQDERLIAGYIELSHSSIDDHAGIDGLKETLARELLARGKWEFALRLLLEPQFDKGVKHVSGLYSFLRNEEDSELIGRLGVDWLTNFPAMSDIAQIELVDQLLRNPVGSKDILSLLRRRVTEELSDDLRLAWDAVGIILDFDGTRARLDGAGGVSKELLWSLRARLAEKNGTHFPTPLDAEQLAWIIEKFRPFFPYTEHPTGGWSGDTNSWDATEYLSELINRLGDKTSSIATKKLVALRDAPRDGYYNRLRVAAAEQKRKRIEASWVAPDIGTFASAIADHAPTNAPQLQAVILEELKQVQNKITGSALDWYKDFFFDDGTPRGEEDCRDTILKMFGELPFGIQAAPEGHLADNKRCDIECTLPGIMVPIEIKGQWHKDLWTAADTQLDVLYTNDWRAERGIYLVLWFGPTTEKKLKRPPLGIDTPETAAQLQSALAGQSATTQEGRTEIVVLDLTRPG